MNLLYSVSFPASATFSQNFALYYLLDPSVGNSEIIADFAPSVHPGWFDTSGDGTPDTPGQFIYSTTFDGITAIPTVYDSDALFGNSLTLTSLGTGGDSVLYYDFVLHGTSFANSGGGVNAPASISGGQASIFVDWNSPETSMNLRTASEVTSNAVSHTCSYAVPNNSITGVGLAFSSVPEPSGVLLVFLTGGLAHMRRRRRGQA